MTEMNMITELLQTSIGTQGQLLIPRKIHDTLIQETEKMLIPRSEAAFVVGPAQIPGSSYDIDFTTANTLKVREVGEGAEIVLSDAEYTTSNVRPKKYGVNIRITRELMEDAKWNMLQLNVQLAGKRLAENENSLIISSALDSAANTVSGGAAITIANITRAMQYLEDSDFKPTTLFVGNEVLNDLRNIDTFVEANKVGNTEMLSRGFLGVIYGLNVIQVSTNAGMTTTSSYVTDKSQAYCIVEKRPITVEGFTLPTFDMEGTAVTQRIAVAALRTSAIAKITTS